MSLVDQMHNSEKIVRAQVGKTVSWEQFTKTVYFQIEIVTADY